MTLLFVLHIVVRHEFKSPLPHHATSMMLAQHEHDRLRLSLNIIIHANYPFIFKRRAVLPSTRILDHIACRSASANMENPLWIATIKRPIPAEAAISAMRSKESPASRPACARTVPRPKGTPVQFRCRCASSATPIGHWIRKLCLANRSAIA